MHGSDTAVEQNFKFLMNKIQRINKETKNIFFKLIILHERNMKS